MSPDCLAAFARLLVVRASPSCMSRASSGWLPDYFVRVARLTRYINGPMPYASILFIAICPSVRDNMNNLWNCILLLILRTDVFETVPCLTLPANGSIFYCKATMYYVLQSKMHDYALKVLCCCSPWFVCSFCIQDTLSSRARLA